MILEKQLIMTIGMTENNWELTKEMVENSIKSFHNAPIVWNERKKYKDYNYNNIDNYRDCKVIGMIPENSKIIIEDNNVYADISLFEEYNGIDLWKGKFDNWCIQFDKNNDSKFVLNSIEVF